MVPSASRSSVSARCVPSAHRRRLRDADRRPRDASGIRRGRVELQGFGKLENRLLELRCFANVTPRRSWRRAARNGPTIRATAAKCAVASSVRPCSARILARSRCAVTESGKRRRVSVSCALACSVFPEQREDAQVLVRRKRIGATAPFLPAQCRRFVELALVHEAVRQREVRARIPAPRRTVARRWPSASTSSHARRASGRGCDAPSTRQGSWRGCRASSVSALLYTRRPCRHVSEPRTARRTAAAAAAKRLAPFPSGEARSWHRPRLPR